MGDAVVCSHVLVREGWGQGKPIPGEVEGGGEGGHVQGLGPGPAEEAQGIGIPGLGVEGDGGCTPAWVLWDGRRW